MRLGSVIRAGNGFSLRHATDAGVSLKTAVHFDSLESLKRAVAVAREQAAELEPLLAAGRWLDADPQAASPDDAARLGQPK